MSEIDRELALSVWDACTGRNDFAPSRWPLKWYYVGPEPSGGEEVPGVRYTDPRAWGLLIEAIEALPGVTACEIRMLQTSAVVWKRAALACEDDGYGVGTYRTGDCYGEALARLLVQLVEREGGE